MASLPGMGRACRLLRDALAGRAAARSGARRHGLCLLRGSIVGSKPNKTKRNHTRQLTEPTKFHGLPSRMKRNNGQQAIDSAT